jgi:hypothetical protein
MVNAHRCRRLVERAIERFSLNLEGYTVLTEAATGYYLLTPLIAALAGAQQVYALTRDSRYGNVTDVYNETMKLARRWGVAQRVEIFCSRTDPRINQADIVTNLGFVRPLDQNFLRRLKPTAVIPLMFETWEYRAEDLDLAECRRLEIPVLGTNEHHPDLQIFDYIGHLALKLLYKLDVEVFQSLIIVLGSGEFAEVTRNTLESAGAQVFWVESQSPGALAANLTSEVFRSADALVIVEHQSRRRLIGYQAEIKAEDLKASNPGLVVAHICGGVDRDALAAAGLRCAPDQFALPAFMSVATDYLGPKPMILLHTAGLKVGEELARARLAGFDAKKAELLVLEQSPLAQGFTG